MKNNTPLVSINIRTYNSASTLGDTLESVRRQSYKQIEILISDGYSTDDSVRIAKSYGASVRYADKLGDARYQNIVHSKGIYVLSLDSDQVLDRALVTRCVQLCERKKIDAVTIAERSLIQKNTLIEKLIAYDKWLIDESQSTDAVFGTACPRFFRKSVLDLVQWPKDLAIFDDTLLYTQLLKRGAKVTYLHTPSIGHYEVTSWMQLWKKFYRYGRGYVDALKNEPTTIAMHSLPRSSYFHRAALKNPFYFFGLMIMYCVKVCAASLGALSSIVERIVTY